MLQHSSQEFQHLWSVLEQYYPLSSDAFEPIRDRFDSRTLSKGEYFLRGGEACDSIAFISSGFLRNYTLTEGGVEVTTHFAYASSFALSFFSFKSARPSFESIVALEDLHILVISRDNLAYLHRHVPEWTAVYLAIIEEAYARMEERTFIIQNYSAQQKYLTLVGEAHPSIREKASLGHIASYLGISSETLSRVRKKLAKGIF